MAGFQGSGEYDHEDVTAALARNDAQQLQEAVIAVALGDADYAFASALCERLASHADPTVRGNALLGFGHLARRFGLISSEARALVATGLEDRDPHVRAHSESAMDDIETFVK